MNVVKFRCLLAKQLHFHSTFRLQQKIASRSLFSSSASFKETVRSNSCQSNSDFVLIGINVVPLALVSWYLYKFSRESDTDSGVHCESSDSSFSYLDSEREDSKPDSSHKAVYKTSLKTLIPQKSHESPSSSMSGLQPSATIKHYDYIIVGTGTSGQAALELLKQSDPTARFLIVTEHNRLPKPDVDEEEVQLCPELREVFNRWRRHVTSHLTTMVDDNTDVIVTKKFSGMSIDPENKLLRFSNMNYLVSYNKCLLAPQGRIRSSYVLDTSSVQYSLSDNINSLRNRMDFKQLENLQQLGEGQKKRIAIVGGGFLGAEVASALAKLNSGKSANERTEIFHIFFEQYALSIYFPKYLAKHITEKLKSAGITTMGHRLITDVDRIRGGADSVLGTASGIRACLFSLDEEVEELELDCLVLANTRIDPEIEIARRSGLEIDRKNGGILVNSSLEAYRDLFVAGNAASFFSKTLGRRRCYVYDHAMNSGLTCARNMLKSNQNVTFYNQENEKFHNDNVTQASDRESHSERNSVKVNTKLSVYTHQPAFLCVLPGLNLKFECVGEVDANLKTVGVWLAKRDQVTGQPSDKSDFKRGVIYYLKDSKVVGIVCCNAGECLENARNILNEDNIIEDDAAKHLKKKILLGPEHWLLVYTTK